MFSTLWLGVVSAYIYDSVNAANGFVLFPEANVCVQVTELDASAAFVNAIFDTLVYLAISWKMSSFSTIGDNRRARLKSFIRGDGLLGLSKSLLRSGQVYYL